MPELPEVETIRTQLLTILPFRIVKAEYSEVSASILKSKEFDPIGLTIVDIKRKGKMLDFILEDENHILSHLGMSGSWRISDLPITEKHTHIQFEGTNYHLAYVDPRRFGNMFFYKSENANKKFNALGVDITSDDFNAEFLQELFLKFPDKKIKPFLLEQKYFFGVGNYIASEICARSGILPTRTLSKITKAECNKIIKSTAIVLEGAIQNSGTTFAGGYADTTGERGQGVQNLVVFFQKTCGLCKRTKVKKVMLAGRGTYFCPKCQK